MHRGASSLLRLALITGALVSLPGGLTLAAPPPEPARARASAALIDEVVGRLLPLDVVLPGQPGSTPDGGSDGPSQAALLTELRYCGVTDKGTGRFRAVLRWGTLGAAPAVLAGADGCRQSLGDLARRAGAGAAPPVSDSGVAVADLEASWRPWELKLSMVRAMMPPAPTPPRPGPPRPLAAVELRRDLLTLPTSGLRIPTDAGEAITVHAAPSFASDGIEVAVVVADGSAPPASRPTVGGGALPVSPDTGANLAVELPYGTANQVLRQLSGSHPIAIPVDRDVIDLQNLSVAPGSGGAALAGLATPRSLRETVRLTVFVAGADLKVSAVRADAQLENCAALGSLAAIACSARNAARNTAAAAFAAAASQKYQGRLVRELASPQVLSVDFGTRRLELRGDLTRAALGARGLVVWGRLSPGGPAN